MKLLLTCEHGGHEVPTPYRRLFAGARGVLRSHRGWDPGALPLFELMRPAADAAFHATVSRLVVELNRSPGHPRLFSEYTRRLDRPVRTALLDTHYHPFRRSVADRVRTWLADGADVFHISVHSFTRVLDGRERDLDIGLLYDPRHGDERVLAEVWQQGLGALDPRWRVRRNRPYRGVADGHPRWLRAMFGPRYRGFELEVRSDHLRSPRSRARVAAALIGALGPILETRAPHRRPTSRV